MINIRLRVNWFYIKNILKNVFLPDWKKNELSIYFLMWDGGKGGLERVGIFD